MKKQKIAILGSTGHIAKGLIENLSKDHELVLYSRSQDKPLGLFPYLPHDVVINCIGVGEHLWKGPIGIFNVTEKFDNMALDHLQRYPETLYINFSSGAVFGRDFDKPVHKFSLATIDVNDMTAASFYGIAKLNSEAKHRALDKFSIVDIRVFSYFSRHLRPECPCLMNEILTAIREDKELLTSPQEFYRDYIHPKDLAQLVERCIDLHNVNAAFDAYSRRPISKTEILVHFALHHGLRWKVDESFKEASPTGPKLNYYSENTAAEHIGYAPKYSSLDAIAEEGSVMLSTTYCLPPTGVL